MTKAEEINEKLIAAMRECLELSTAEGLGKFMEPYSLTIREYNLLPAKYRCSIKQYRIIFIKGVGWRRANLRS